MQSESRKRLQSETDSKRNNDKYIDDLQAREKTLLDQVTELKSGKQRLEDTVYRLKSEAMATTESIKELKEQLDEEKRKKVSENILISLAGILFGTFQ